MKTKLCKLLCMSCAFLSLLLPVHAANGGIQTAAETGGYGIKIPFTPCPRTSSYTFTVYDEGAAQVTKTLEIFSPQTVFLPFSYDPARVKTYTLEVTANVDPLRLGLDRPYTKRVTFDAGSNCGHPNAAGALLAGDGSADAPYLVTNIAQLDHIFQHSGSSSSDRTYFLQTGDIAYDGRSWASRNLSNVNYNGNGYRLTGFKPSGGSSVFGSVTNLSLSNFGMEDFYTSYSPICTASNNIALSKCYLQSGTIQGDGANLGPLSGMGNSDALPMSASNCYVAAVSVTGSTNVGGLIGNSINLVLQNCFTIPTAINTSGVKAGVSWSAASPSNIQNVYWLSDSASSAFSAAAADTNSSATALTSAQMQQQSSYSGFDFGSVWRWDEALKHPVLRVFDH